MAASPGMRPLSAKSSVRSTIFGVAGLRDDGQDGIDGRDERGRRSRAPGQLSPLTGDQSRRGVEGVDHRSNTQGVGAHSAVPQQQLGADEDGADAE